MFAFILGAIVLFVLMGGLRAFERASVKSVKSLLIWVAALGGLSLALLMILTGRAPAALGALALLGPMLYQNWQAGRGRRPEGVARPAARAALSRQEALEVLGLDPGATEAEIREAHLRLMRAAHPDAGGSDWLASRINQARDVLLG